MKTTENKQKRTKSKEDETDRSVFKLKLKMESVFNKKNLNYTAKVLLCGECKIHTKYKFLTIAFRSFTSERRLFHFEYQWLVLANICLTSLTHAKCGIPSTLCWKIPNISGSIELFAL